MNACKMLLKIQGCSQGRVATIMRCVPATRLMALSSPSSEVVKGRNWSLGGGASLSPEIQM